jgi:hypothetical protein
MPMPGNTAAAGVVRMGAEIGDNGSTSFPSRKWRGAGTANSNRSGWGSLGPIFTPWGAHRARVYVSVTPSLTPNPSTFLVMGHLFLAIFLIVFGANMLFALSLPLWVLGVLAVIAGVLLLGERLGIGGSRKS